MLNRNVGRLIELGGPVLLAVFLLWTTSYRRMSGGGGFAFHFPSPIKDFTTIFLSIFLEAIPFVLLGTLVSSCILVFVSEDRLQRFLPRQPLAAIFPAILLAVCFPICECAIIPVVKRLIQKGMPAHLGIIFLIVTPIVNPIVFLSTHLAFRMNPAMVYGRMGLAIGVAVAASLLVYYMVRDRSILKSAADKWVVDTHSEHAHHQHAHHEHTHHGPNHSKETSQLRLTAKLWSVLYHTTDEFFDVSKFVIFGALIASFAQVSLNRALLGSFADSILISTLLMMGLAFLLSICSEADAFVGASFSSLVPPGAIVAFLVFGAIFDIKNTMMLFSVFKASFVLFFMALITLLVLGGSVTFEQFIIHMR
ncbi:permease [Aneurinibacillus sp. Ricciae_BoGa-3]|uniref:permease n=1 Tax=Aneurinibacillus sp. Ricciae_BoGa-3 TaxID=3022697 RepID=UPI002340C2A7|nr:permease [Aneurinibacillus sp. Ricciae_BoGa-3]WCK53247.1 permease [Aneurinibacillus sp. Ricciae_BoGa-3]